MYASLQEITRNHETPIGHSISEEDKIKFMELNCFECKPIGAKITKDHCKAFQDMAYQRQAGHPGAKCLDCKKMKSAKKPKPKRKICELHKDFPGYCMGKGEFYEKVGARPHEFKGKHYCLGKCGHRHNYFKRMGYKSASEVKGRVTKSFRPEMVG
jgi:hypothetical protein